MVPLSYSLVLTVGAVCSLTTPLALAADVGASLQDDLKIPVGKLQTWPQGIVPYHLNDNLEEAAKAKIKLAMETIQMSVNNPQQKPCISFVESKDFDSNYVEIYQGSGCSSSVGMISDEKRQELSIGVGCEFKGIIMHELLHTLGLYHEHCRSDRNTYVSIDLSNVDSDDVKNFDLIDEIDLQGMPFDPESIMCYDPFMKAVDSSRPVIVPKQDMANNVFQMGQRMWLSDMDVLRIQKLYNCKNDTTHIVRPELDNTVFACNFQFGLCDMTNTGGNFNWVVQSQASSTGPGAGHSTGNDNFAVAKANGNKGKTAKITTPTIFADSLCIDFYIFLKDDTSTLTIEAFGSMLTLVKISFKPSTSGYNRWIRYQKQLDMLIEIYIQISFIAEIQSVDVALDDIRLYKGACQ